ncbi:dTDP-4-dehydrorhamnose reductase [Curtobacterium sp. RRHDQ10]|uniref:dTDP-4-dehydrorhamnose reductase n=1 Tax=Curtobacterium phyllosphaerae TaxID=3413379 RepID=UPI003BF05C1D
MTRYLITGATGMLGQDLQQALAGRDVTALSRAELDITDTAAVERAVVGHDVVINSAAYTKVDDAESAGAEDAHRVNADGPAVLARASVQAGARLVTISTDYVFDGHGTAPYAEDAPTDPVNAYGRSKAAGEARVRAIAPDSAYIVRTAWIYGAHGPNFAKTILRLAGSHDTVSVVADQIGQPTWTVDLAERIVGMLDADAPAGVYHGTNAGQASWFDFTTAIFTEAGLDPARVLPTDSTAFVRPAPRPAYSVLGHDGWSRAGLPPMRDWREALHTAAEAGVLTAS